MEIIAFIGPVVVLLLLFFIYDNLRLMVRQNKTLIDQNQKILEILSGEEKDKNTDSSAD
ncbi:MAG: hypothetical protein H0Z33_00125 [Bacillaceae bacterium]|nr:hypothetical protein [Bacillaceae bacterium]